MVWLFAASQLDNVVQQTKSMFDGITKTFLSGRSILAFIVAMTIAVILGRIIAAIMRRFARALSRGADKTQNLKEVNRLRRIETLVILAAALVRTILIILGLYFWWIYAYPHQQPSALIGASALVVIIASGTVGPILRDLAYGGVMMAEHWYGVGDHIRVEPFANLQGVVERVTLRSTKIRGINGEIIWLNNQNIQGVRVLPKGVRTLAMDIFVTNLDKGLKLIESTNLRLPTGPLMLVRPLHIMSKAQLGTHLWHITAVGETAPGREWLLENYAKRIMHEVDLELHGEDDQVLQTDPIVHDADSDADKRFARTIQNARKSPLERKHLPLPESIAKQIEKPLRRSNKTGAHLKQSPPKRRKMRKIQ